MLDALKRDVCEANLELVRRDLVLMTWGNASAIDRDRGIIVIKPSGVDYDAMRPEHMAVVDLEGKVVEGDLRPSVDTATHLCLYEAFPGIGGIVHTHSHYATSWAQACRPIPCFGTTHADHFHGEVPLTEPLTEAEVADDYERHIGDAIVWRFEGLDPTAFPGVLCAKHASFTWGETVAKAVDNATILEEVARMASDTLSVSPDQPPIEEYLLDKHFLRKHGKGAYYGQG
ncbi:MAG: L-ribulose-5-phosphate 4-epimerase AraD [bacterium]|nr:L-ribulose-5-phosphate 4-epimerase AraD [bacterium]